jgi:pimeloyl-ACP methyl ester carboxylesterase
LPLERMMAAVLPLVLVPGLLCSARVYAPHVSALWPFGQVTVADHRHDGTMAAIAARILAAAPPLFALAGHSMGGYIAFAMLRQAPERIAKLALLDTSARPDTAEQSAAREKSIATAQAGKLDDVVETLTPRLLHRNRHNDEALKRVVREMAEDTGAEALSKAFRPSPLCHRQAGCL